MALRKPLVIIDGLVQKIPSGETLDATVQATNALTLTNANAASITIGQPVYVSAADTVDLANSAAIGTSRPLGLVSDASIAASATGNIQTSGSLTSSDWTSVVGAATLTAGSVYYLDGTAGKLPATAPTTGFLTKVGAAVSTTELEINIEQPIGL